MATTDQAAPDAPSAETATAQPPAKWSRYQVWLLAVLVMVSVCNTMDRGIVSLLQEAIKTDLKLSDAQLGLISGPAFALFYSIAGLPVARLAERANRPNLLALAVAFWSSMTALCGFAVNFVQLALLRAGVGIGEGGANPISHSLVADQFSVRQRGIAMAVLSAATPISGIIIPLTAGVIAHFHGWRIAFIAAAVPGLILAVVLKLTIREPRLADPERPRPSHFAADLGWLARNRAFVFVFLAAAFNGIGIQGTGIFTTSFLIRNHDLDLAQAGTVMGAIGGVGLLGTFIGGYLADRFADSRGRSYVLVPAAGAVLSFLCFMFAFRLGAFAPALAALLLANVATDLKNGPNFAAVQNIVPSRMRATAAAMFFLAATVVGMGLGATLVGAMSDLAASGAFTAGDYGALCRGGHAVAGAAPGVEAACVDASAAGLRIALGILPCTFLFAALFFWLASRTIRINEE
ncbi:MFS transporter [Sphingomonas gilva]|uniref:MFS transporter n=1 Tax=Sphingomonas gilva TaxID=2305907 RepID=A0A396RRI8_9SPHN|nr:MFS transporter [Sphingomonas gilva]RHW19254.1 MFS transporter [Sphingomonas gilva]